MKNRLRLALHPPPTTEQADTSLRYTDILFGFVIRELFLRLQNWSQLNSGVRWHLIVGITLVLGSWIGFRRSLNRTTYDVKFFNLPMFRFLVDQLMLILYFRIAVLTKVDGTSLPNPSDLAADTVRLVLFVFTLYVLWDLLGIWMAKAKAPTEKAGQTEPRYARLKKGEVTNPKEVQPINWSGFFISVSILAILVVLWRINTMLDPNGLFLAIFLLLLFYRMTKEMRTSWQSSKG
ncbi:MAG TPA: hypothetical protein VLX28_18585 [Thermoanaerobaculia bacterium]|nr:hypothetical protein [Thermoanaerobaculia bacterium]